MFSKLCGRFDETSTKLRKYLNNNKCLILNQFAVVLLKYVSQEAFVFFTNYQSQKSIDIKNNNSQ